MVFCCCCYCCYFVICYRFVCMFRAKISIWFISHWFEIIWFINQFMDHKSIFALLCSHIRKVLFYPEWNLTLEPSAIVTSERNIRLIDDCKDFIKIRMCVFLFCLASSLCSHIWFMLFLPFYLATVVSCRRYAMNRILSLDSNHIFLFPLRGVATWLVQISFESPINEPTKKLLESLKSAESENNQR